MRAASDIEVRAPWGGMPDGQACDPAIETPRDLSALKPGVAASMAQRLAMEDMASRLMAVEMRDGSVAIFAAPGYVRSDHADALERRLLECGYRLSHPARYAVASPLLLSLARGQHALSGPKPAGGRVPEEPGTALGDVFQDVLDWAVAHHASDIHFNVSLRQAHSQVRFTIGGRYVQPERFRSLSSRMVLDILSVAWMDIRGGNGAVFDPGSEQQGSLTRMCGDRPFMLRWSSLAAEQGPSVCLRLQDRSEAGGKISLESLGYFPEQAARIGQAVGVQGGAVVVSGTVGAGKSTTLASMLGLVPAHRKVVTIEDPVERLLPDAIQNSVARDLHGDSHEAYTAKLRSLKRAALDDVCLGEIRDRETGLVFSDSVSSGVGVYTTVHAPSAAGIVDRLCSSFIGIPRDLLMSPGILKLLVHQALLPVVCDRCAIGLQELCVLPGRQGAAWRQWRGRMERMLGQDCRRVRWRDPRGCETCRRRELPELNGYGGRTVAAEILTPGDDASRDAEGCRVLLPARHRALPGARPDKHSALGAAVRKMLDGQVDPRDVQERFSAFLMPASPCRPGDCI